MFAEFLVIILNKASSIVLLRIEFFFIPFYRQDKDGCESTLSWSQFYFFLEIPPPEQFECNRAEEEASFFFIAIYIKSVKSIKDGSHIKASPSGIKLC